MINNYTGSGNEQNYCKIKTTNAINFDDKDDLSTVELRCVHQLFEMGTRDFKIFVFPNLISISTYLKIPII